jgi:hypothetical protein
VASEWNGFSFLKLWALLGNGVVYRQYGAQLLLINTNPGLGFA